MRGWRLGALQWTGEARRLQVRVHGRVSRVRAHYVWSPEEPLGRSLQMAGSPAIITGRPGARTSGSAATARGSPKPSQPPSSITPPAGGVHACQVSGRRTRDLPVPRARKRLGRRRLQLPRRPVRPGVRGPVRGVERNVIGAHSQGFNTGTVGISLIGNYAQRSPTPAARAASCGCSRGAWMSRTSTLVRTRPSSPGEPEVRKGAPLFLRAISVTATRASRPAPGACIATSRNRLGGGGARTAESSTRQRSKAGWASSSASRPGSRRHFRGR